MNKQDDERDAATRALKDQERADRRYARLDRFTKPILSLGGAALLALPVLLLAASQGWDGVLILAAIVSVGGAFCAGAYRLAYELARQEELRARYDRAGVRPLTGLAQFAAILALLVAIGLLLFGPELALALATWFGGGPPHFLLLWVIITAIAIPLLVLPAIPLIEQGVRAGMDALPPGRSPRAAAQGRALIAAAILFAISVVHTLARLFS